MSWRVEDKKSSTKWILVDQSKSPEEKFVYTNENNNMLMELVGPGEKNEIYITDFFEKPFNPTRDELLLYELEIGQDYKDLLEELKKITTC